MSKWARIENGIVQEITGINPVGRFVVKLAKQFVSCNDAVQQGYKYTDGIFLLPEQEQQTERPYENVDHDKLLLAEALAAHEARLIILEGSAKA